MDKPAVELVHLMLRAHEAFAAKLSVDGRLATLADADPDEIRRVIRSVADSNCDEVLSAAGVTLSSDQRHWLVEAVIDEAFGLGPLEPLVRDKHADAVIIRGPREVWIELGWQLAESVVAFADEEHVQRTLHRQPGLTPYLKRLPGEGGSSWRIDLANLRQWLAKAAS